MNDRQWHIEQIFTAELEFRLASAVRLTEASNCLRSFAGTWMVSLLVHRVCGAWTACVVAPDRRR